METFIILFLTVHISAGYFIQRTILKSELLGAKQKIINSILIWLLPFVWYWIIKDVLKSGKTPTTKYRRGKTDGSFYESGIGNYID